MSTTQAQYRRKGAYNVNPHFRLTIDDLPETPPPPERGWISQIASSLSEWLHSSINPKNAPSTAQSNSSPTLQPAPQTEHHDLGSQPGPALPASRSSVVRPASVSTSVQPLESSSRSELAAPLSSHTTAISASQVKQSATAGERQRRPPETNIINDRLRKLLLEHWLSSGPPARPSSTDLEDFNKLCTSLAPLRRRPKLLPDIPVELKPEYIRFSPERDYKGPHTTWNKVMAKRFVHSHVLPDFQQTICLPEGKAHNVEDLATSVLKKVYRIFEELYETPQDKEKRLRVQNSAQNRISLYRRRLAVANALPEYKHMAPMLLQLGAEGMSSDEDDLVADGSNSEPSSSTTTGTASRRSRVHRRIRDHPWRSFLVTLALRALDSISITLQSSQGNRCNLRQYRGPIPSNREEGHAMVASIVLGLPENYYNWTKLESWKGSMSQVQWTLRKWVNPIPAQPSPLSVPAVSDT